MKTIELTQGQVALVDDIDYEYLMQWKWYAHFQDGVYRAKRNLPRVDGKGKLLGLHTAVAGRMGIDITRIDHKDQNPLNNHRENLRAAPRSQNGHNRGAPKNSTTGVKGVCFDRNRDQYMAKIKLYGKTINLGRFDTIAEAAAVVQKTRQELVGEFACA